MVDSVDLLLKPMDGKIKRAVLPEQEAYTTDNLFLINYNALKA